MTAEATPPDVPAKTKPRAAGFAVLVAAGILLSRIAGLIRVRVFAHYLGNSPAAGAYNAGLKIPNFLQNLFGEGVLSASFIPVYARLIAEDDDEMAGRVAGVILSLLGVIVMVIVTVCVFITPWIIDLIAPGFQGEVRLPKKTSVAIMAAFQTTGATYETKNLWWLFRTPRHQAEKTSRPVAGKFLPDVTENFW